jgi:hypothetical protein
MSTGAAISLIVILVVAGALQLIAIYSVFGLFTDRGMRPRKRH